MPLSDHAAGGDDDLHIETALPNQPQPKTMADTSLKASTRRGSSFIGDVLKLFSSAVVTQALSVIAVPILSRLYSPEMFGVFAIYTSITTLVSNISSLGYVNSIVLPDQEKDAANQLVLSIAVTIGISALTGLVLMIWGEALMQLLQASGLVSVLWLIPTGVLIAGVATALSQWSVRKRRFGKIAVVDVLSSGVISGGQIVAGTAGPASGIGLIVTTVFGQFVGLSAFVAQLWRNDAAFIRGNVRWSSLWGGAKRYQRFPKYDTWSTLLNTLSWQLPTFMLSLFFTPAVAGFYALGNRVLRVPISLISRTVGQVFFQRAARARTEGPLGDLMEHVLIRYISFGLYPFVILLVLSPELFGLIFGAEWTEAGTFSQILSIWSFIWFTASSLSSVFYVLERQDFILKWNIWLLITRILALGAGGLAGDARLTIALFGASGIIMYGYFCGAMIVYSGASWPRLSRSLLRYSALAVIFVLPIYIFLRVSESLGWTLLLAAMLSGAYYLLVGSRDQIVRNYFQRIRLRFADFL